MPQVSLKRRFISNTLVILISVMAMSAFLVDLVFRNEVRNAGYEKLRAHIYALMAVSSVTEDSLLLPHVLANPEFNRLHSGLWAAVLDAEQTPLWESLSLSAAPNLHAPPLAVGEWGRTVEVLAGERYLTLYYKVAWANEGRAKHYYFVVGEHISAQQQALRTFQARLYSGFLLVTLVLLLLQYFALRAAFQPLVRLQHDIKSLEMGDKRCLDSDYPVELQGCTGSVNQLLDSEHRQKERYRTAMADMAHSLKTPLAALKLDLSKASVAPSAMSSLNKIDTLVEYHLRRAVISNHRLARSAVPVQRCVEDILDALKKVYRDKPLHIATNNDNGASFKGDPNDLLEVLGNLLDNAFKYARHQVRVQIEQEASTLTIHIDDDGPGLDAALCAEIFNRGKRLDQKGIGQGIGLAVAQDIVAQYAGSIQVATSSLGGASFSVKFGDLP